MNALVLFLQCASVLLGLMVFFGSTVKAQCQKNRLEIKSLCQTKATYGTVIGDYTVSTISKCSAYCTGSCKSFTYDEITGRCKINRLTLADVPACSTNVKYGRTEQCVVSGQIKICSPNLRDIPGQIRGYLLANPYGEWGTVCDDEWESDLWGYINAYVVCKSLGYGYGVPVYPLYSHAQYYDGKIVLDNIQCYGFEASILHCLYDSHTADCSHGEDVLVICGV